jgi:hypothetical protein
MMCVKKMSEYVQFNTNYTDLVRKKKEKNVQITDHNSLDKVICYGPH